MTDTTRAAPIQLGLRENLGQFALLVGVNALVGGMIGQERTVLPLLADRVFGLTAYTAALTFILAFGATKAAHQLLRRHAVRPRTAASRSSSPAGSSPSRFRSYSCGRRRGVGSSSPTCSSA